MFGLLISFLFFAAVFGFNIEIINDENYESFIKKNDNVFLMYFRKPHSYCAIVKPRFQDASLQADKQVKFARIDCSSTGKITCRKSNKHGHPEFTFFKKGIPIGDYRGDFKTSDFVDFVEDMMENNVEKLDTMESLRYHFDINDDKPIAVGFFEDEVDLKEIFIKTADKMRQWLNFALVSFSPMEDFKNQIVLYQPKIFRNDLEPDFTIYNGPKNEDDLIKWIKENQHGFVRYRKVKNSWQFDDLKPSVITYFRIDFSNPDSYSLTLRNNILKVAQKFKAFNFYISSTAEFPQELLNYGFEENTKSNRPIVTIKYQNKKYKMEDPFSVENMSNFLDNLVKGNLEPYIMSQDIPEMKENEKIVQVVGKNIEQKILSDKNDILVMFYSPWSSPCKRVYKKIKELYEKLDGEEITFMKMDAANNDVPHLYEIGDFPTIYWISKMNREAPKLYKGGYDLKSLTKFVSAQATEELKHFTRGGQPKEKEEL